MSRTFFVSRAGQQDGPITEDELQKLVELGHLKADDLVWTEGATEWMPAASVLNQRAAGAATPAGPSVAQGAPGALLKAE